MVTRLLDANVLIALFDADHVHHAVVRDWFVALPNPFATCPIVQGALVRWIVRIEGRDGTAGRRRRTWGGRRGRRGAGGGGRTGLGPQYPRLRPARGAGGVRRRLGVADFIVSGLQVFEALLQLPFAFRQLVPNHNRLVEE